MQTLYIGEDNIVQVGTVERPLKRASDGATITTATITGQLKSEDLTAAIGSSISLPHIGDGVYQGSLPSDLSLTQDTIYFLDLTISGSLDGFRRVKCQARYHHETP
ncbi:MAG: hypothetical protein AB7I37_25325 [Pirellulales bacterium]